MNCRIGIVCNYELKEDRIGGMDRFFKAYNEELYKLGAEVCWFFKGNNKPAFHRDLEVHLSGNETVESYFLSFLDQNPQFEVVITHFMELCTAFFKEIKNHRKDTYTIAVDHNPRPLKGFPLKKRLKNRLKGSFYARYTDLFVGVSKYTVDHIKKDYGLFVKHKTQLIYNGIAAGKYKKRMQTNYGKFIVASHLRASKGIHDLIEAVNMLPVSIKEQMQIDVYGEGPMENSLKGKVEELKLEKVIKFYGSSSRLPERFQNYSFLLQPTYMECFSLSILESLASNVPVVTTTVGGNTEIIREKENGYLFEAGNIDKLSHLLKGIMEKEKVTPGEVYQLIEKEYNLEKMVQQHIALIPCI